MVLLGIISLENRTSSSFIYFSKIKMEVGINE